MHWQSIDTAKKDGSTILVNDTNETSGIAPWVAAKWVSSDAWSGWAYDEELLNDSIPEGPMPTHWLDVPVLEGSDGSERTPYAWEITQGARTFFVSADEFTRFSYDYGSFKALYE